MNTTVAPWADMQTDLIGHVVVVGGLNATVVADKIKDGERIVTLENSGDEIDVTYEWAKKNDLVA